MIGPEGVKVPSQTQALTGLGAKQVSDLIAENMRLSVSGTHVSLTGDAKNISDPWTEYAKTDNTGHFLPMTLPKVCEGKKITIEGRKSGNRTVKVDADLLLVQRLENLSGDTMTVKLEGETLMTVDVSGVNRL